MKSVNIQIHDIQKFIYKSIQHIYEFIQFVQLTFHTRNNHTLRTVFPGKFYNCMMYIQKIWNLSNDIIVFICFCLVKIPHYPNIIQSCYTMEISSSIKIVVANMKTFPNKKRRCHSRGKSVLVSSAMSVPGAEGRNVGIYLVPCFVCNWSIII